VVTRKNAGWWVIGVAFALIALPVAGKVLTGLLVLVAYLLSLQKHPHRDCRTCGGTGFHRGYVFAFAHRRCAACGGQSRHRRFGNVVLSPGRPTRAERKAAEAGQRRNRPLP
jgi:hypothetical protein